MSSTLISIVLPVFNEEAGITNTIQVLEKFVHSRPENYELIFVNDGSKDSSSLLIQQAQKHYSNIKYIQFSRNFGQQIAITAGLRYTSGDAVVVMDADLQDPPSVIPEMIKKWKDGYQVVYGKRLDRAKESWFKKSTSKLFYRVLNSITKINLPLDVGDFRLMDRKIVNCLRKMNEPDPYLRGMVSWIGFTQTAVCYHRQARNAGKSKYSMGKMLHLATDGITSFSSFPLRLSGITGIFLLLIGFVALFLTLIVKASISYVIIDLMLILTGLMLSMMGILDTYLYRIFDSSRNRPLYIIAKKSGFKTHSFSSKK